MLTEALLDSEAEEIVSEVIEQAKEGNMIALRLCLERILPPRRESPGEVRSASSHHCGRRHERLVGLVQAVAGGELTPSEAAEIGAMVHAHVKLLEVAELERRVVALEQARQTARRLLARLDRLTPAAGAVLGQDRRRDGRRRDELLYRSMWPGLTEPEQAELSDLEALFRDEDRERARMFELAALRGFPICGPPLTPAEKLELTELEHRYPPPNPYLDEAVVECLSKAIEGWSRPSVSSRSQP